MLTAPWLPLLGWKPSPNFSARIGSVIDMIVLHDMEGYQKPSEELFEETSSHVSAHFTISSDGSTIDQMVAIKNKAWHACDYNSRSVGIEMEGFSKNNFPSVELVTAARLVAHLCKKLNIPIKYSKGGVGPGIASHWTLGAAGGGHSDPEPNDAFMIAFVALVQTESDAGRFPIQYDPDTGLVSNPDAHDLTKTLGVQEALASLGFNIQADGQIGPETERVIGNFQIIAGLPTRPRGLIDDATRAAIQKALTGG